VEDEGAAEYTVPVNTMELDLMVRWLHWMFGWNSMVEIIISHKQYVFSII
jgi:hypothetical protein